jgi:hypothetical protein
MSSNKTVSWPLKDLRVSFFIDVASDLSGMSDLEGGMSVFKQHARLRRPSDGALFVRE